MSVAGGNDGNDGIDGNDRNNCSDLTIPDNGGGGGNGGVNTDEFEFEMSFEQEEDEDDEEDDDDDYDDYDDDDDVFSQVDSVDDRMDSGSDVGHDTPVLWSSFADQLDFISRLNTIVEALRFVDRSQRTAQLEEVLHCTVMYICPLYMCLHGSHYICILHPYTTPTPHRNYRNYSHWTSAGTPPLVQVKEK